MEIHKDKVRRIARTIAMSHYCIHLEGAWSAIVQVVLVGVPPGTEHAEAHDQNDSDDHTNECRDQGKAFSRLHVASRCNGIRRCPMCRLSMSAGAPLNEGPLRYRLIIGNTL